MQPARIGKGLSMLRWLVLAVALLSIPALAAGEIDEQIRQVQAALTRISQEQQAVYQQFQMVQELRRSELAQVQPLQSYTPPATPPNYDDVQREQEERTARIQQHQEELDRLYALPRRKSREAAARGAVHARPAAQQPAVVLPSCPRRGAPEGGGVVGACPRRGAPEPPRHFVPPLLRKEGSPRGDGSCPSG
jgi:hypothetical protein